ncbi:MAG: hypothetical protein HYT66_01160 [Candidatus Yanofskybacteria bacterium]|nr:hypothetical protein [Candidatus Yanofskybacteria bacterium]
MENNLENRTKDNRSNYILAGSILGAALMLSLSWIYIERFNTPAKSADLTALAGKVTPAKGVVLPVKWGDLGIRMAEAGIIDKDKFTEVYAGRGGLDSRSLALLNEKNNGDVTITPQNAQILLNLFWALGLGNKNEILDKGPMKDPKYGGADRFASTGGWTLAKGNAMEHYSVHEFISLTPEQQSLVEETSKNIYRTCCGNSTYFPDCNHGMAMLGLLELMASQGISESDMYKYALAVNSYWFPDDYLTIAAFLKERGIEWKKADAKNILGANFSSGSGFRAIKEQVKQPVNNGGGSCGV